MRIEFVTDAGGETARFAAGAGDDPERSLAYSKTICVLLRDGLRRRRCVGDWARAGARKSEQEMNRLSKLVRIELRLRIQLLGIWRVNG